MKTIGAFIAMGVIIILMTIGLTKQHNTITELNKKISDITDITDTKKEVIEDFADLDDDKFELRCRARCQDQFISTPVIVPKAEIVEITKWKERIVKDTVEVIVPKEVPVVKPLSKETVADSLNLMWKAWCIGERHVPDRCAPFRPLENKK